MTVVWHAVWQYLELWHITITHQDLVIPCHPKLTDIVMQETDSGSFAIILRNYDIIMGENLLF